MGNFLGGHTKSWGQRDYKISVVKKFQMQVRIKAVGFCDKYRLMFPISARIYHTFY